MSYTDGILQSSAILIGIVTHVPNRIKTGPRFRSGWSVRDPEDGPVFYLAKVYLV